MTSYIRVISGKDNFEKYKDYFKNFVNLESKRYMKVGHDRFKPLYREPHVEDKENGLQDLTVINLFESLNGNLWLCLNKGVSFVLAEHGIIDRKHRSMCS